MNGMSSPRMELTRIAANVTNYSLHHLGHHSLNCSNDTDNLNDYSYCHGISRKTVVGVLSAIFFFSLLGNITVVLVILLERRSKSFAKWMILNLAFADLSVAVFCIPLEIPLEMAHKWVYNGVFCSMFYPIQTAMVYASVYTLVVLSLSRYYAIVHPYRFQPTEFHAKFIILLVWICSVGFTVPYMAALKLDVEHASCIETWDAGQGRAFTVITFTLQFVLPFTIISIAYTLIVCDVKSTKYLDGGRRGSLPHEADLIEKENSKLTRLVVVVTITFAFCMLPYHVLALYAEFSSDYDFQFMNDINIVCYFVLYLHSAVNPILYNVFSSNFRESLVNFINTARSRSIYLPE